MKRDAYRGVCLTFLALVPGLILLTLPAAAQAGFTYVTNADNTLAITDYTGPGGNVILPSTINGLPVTSIADTGVFGDWSSITSVTIPTNITYVGNSAFYGCTGLRTITIPNSVTHLGPYVFYHCRGLTSVTIGNGVTDLGGGGNGLFEDCTSLTNIAMGDRVTNIVEYAFQGCSNLPSIIIPAGVTYLAVGTFWGCTSLRAVYFKGNAPAVASDSSVFGGVTNATAYYLPGTIGWGPTLGRVNALPTALWNPTIETADANLGVHGNQIGFNIKGTTNIPIAVVACANLSNPNWLTLQTCTLTNGSVYFSDPQGKNYPVRFYRIRSP